MNILNTTAAGMALFLAGSCAVLAGETVKPEREFEVLYALAPVDREILAYTALGIIAEDQDGNLSGQDIIGAAWMFAVTPEEIPAIARDLYLALTSE